MMPRILVMLGALVSWSLACTFEPSSLNNTGIACRITMPAALVLNQQTSRVIQAAFQHATYPDIKGEKTVRFLGGVTYGLTNIHISNLTIENTNVDFKEEEEDISIEIQNVSASFRGTLSYGYVGAWLVKLIHSIDFEIDSSIDLEINTKLTCENELVAADTSDCYLSFHKLTLHLQGDRNPGWVKQLFTDFISFTLKLVLKRQVCKEINFLAQLLANFIQDTAANFLQDGDIGVDITLMTFPIIKSKYLETYHKGFLLYKNHPGIFRGSAFTPSVLSESRMLSFWFSDHVLQSLTLAAFLDERLVLMITGEELKGMLESEELETHREIMQEIFQSTSNNYSLTKVWSLNPPQIALRPEGTVVKSTVAVQLNVSSHGGEPPMVLYFEKEVTVTIQASYAEKKLLLHPTDIMIEHRTFKCSSDIAVNDETLSHILEKIILVAGIPEVISRIEQVLTTLMDSKGLYLFEIKDPEIITREGYFIIQLDFDFPHHLLMDFLNRTL